MIHDLSTVKTTVASSIFFFVAHPAFPSHMFRFLKISSGGGSAQLLCQNAEWSHTSEQIYNELNSTGMRPGGCYFEVTSISADEPILPIASYAFAWRLYVTLGFATTFQLHV